MCLEIIESHVEQLRDPFVLVKDQTYYMYGTNWKCYVSNGDLTNWTLLPKEIVIKPKNYVKDSWAPEVHEYQGAYYMFTTYYSDVAKHRGCTILKSDSPEGPFLEISDGIITPKDWDCIDGTLYVDEDGQPWMIFVHEWVCLKDHIGRMAAAKLSEDFTHFISEPVELFRADDAPWATGSEYCITDGCYMYRTEEGKLLMLWSNFNADGYCVGIVHSENGKLDGKWIHEKEPLFSKNISGNYDGGHGMIFQGLDGKKYLALHSPNDAIATRKEMPVFIEIHEENGTLKFS